MTDSESKTLKKLSWQKNMSVGIPSLDQQHLQIISIINQLIEKMESISIRELETILTELQNYIVKHFQHEEKLLEYNSFPDLAKHKDSHQEFNQKVSEFTKEIKNLQANLKNNEDTINQELKLLVSNMIRFLFQWLLNHILKEDKQYSKLLVKAGAR